MKKALIFFLLVSMPMLILAQQTDKIKLVSSTGTTGYRGSVNYLKIISPVFFHQNSTLSCDSANFYNERNYFEAFGHVHIIQGDSINVYSDFLQYDGNTKNAHLTSNVRMVDKQAVLTTNVLDYNLATKIGTYVGGGKIVNKDNVLTSKNGFYFASTRDAYFRYNVVITSPKSLIKSDTARYNTFSKIAYFYGPTHIYTKDDTLYTENGTYNTNNDQANFGKNNLYTQGSKSLKGDSLFYDGKVGFGKAIGNITFLDTLQKVMLKGQLGFYNKLDQSTLVTKNAYTALATQDSSKKDTLWLAADTLFTKIVFVRDMEKLLLPKIKKDNEVGDDEDNANKDKTEPNKKNNKLPPPPKAKGTGAKGVLAKDGVSPPLMRKGKPVPTEIVFPPPVIRTTPLDTTHLIKPIFKVKAPAKVKVPEPASAKSTKLAAINDSKQKDAKTDPQAQGGKPAVAKKPVIVRPKDYNPNDTTRTRIVSAYHNVKVFKSDMQAKADSMFFTYADSILRCYVSPIMWTQGSQLVADTIYLQLKNKKLDNMLLIRSGFITNVETDSSLFNQIKGKLISGFFKNGKMDRMYVDGNAESIYYAKDDSGYVGMNKSISSRMKVLFAKNELKEVINIKKAEGKYFPIDKLPEDKILPGFSWKPKERPKSKEEIIHDLSRKNGNKKDKPKPPQKPDPKKPGTQAPPAKSITLKSPVSKDSVSIKTDLKKLDGKIPLAKDSIKKAIAVKDSLIKKPASKEPVIKK